MAEESILSVLPDKAFLYCLTYKTGLYVLHYMKDYVIRTPPQLGPILQGYRKTRALTQAQVGQAIGLAQGEISKLELDPSNAALARVFKLLAALNLEFVVRPRGKNTPPSEW